MKCSPYNSSRPPHHDIIDAVTRIDVFFGEQLHEEIGRRAYSVLREVYEPASMGRERSSENVFLNLVKKLIY